MNSVFYLTILNFSVFGIDADSGSIFVLHSTLYSCMNALGYVVTLDGIQIFFDLSVLVPQDHPTELLISQSDRIRHRL